jgi:hypothetical protein
MARTTTITYRKRPTRLTVQTEAAQSRTREPMLPHELDESAERGKAKTPPDGATVQGYADVAQGLVDTECRQEAGRTFEVARRKKLRRLLGNR